MRRNIWNAEGAQHEDDKQYDEPQPRFKNEVDQIEARILVIVKKSITMMKVAHKK